jgi:hypothetical protein
LGFVFCQTRQGINSWISQIGTYRCTNDTFDATGLEEADVAQSAGKPSIRNVDQGFAIRVQNAFTQLQYVPDLTRRRWEIDYVVNQPAILKHAFRRGRLLRTWNICHQNTATVSERTRYLMEAGQRYDSVADATDPKYDNRIHVT